MAHQQCIHLVHDKVSKQDYFHLLHTCGSRLISDNSCIRLDGILQEIMPFTIQMWLFPLKFPRHCITVNRKHFKKETQQLRRYGTKNHNFLRKNWWNYGTSIQLGPDLQGLQQDIPILWKQFHASSGNGRYKGRHGSIYNGTCLGLLDTLGIYWEMYWLNWILIQPVSTWSPISDGQKGLRGPKSSKV